MRKALLIFVAILFCLGWSTSDDKMKVGDGSDSDKTVEFDIGNGTINPKFKYDSTASQLQYSNDGSAFLAIGSGGGGAGGVNLLLTENWDIELGDQKWTESAGTFAVTTGAALVGFDSTSGSMDFSGASQTLSSESISIPNGLKENSCMVSTWTRWPAGTSGDVKLQAYDGSNVLVEIDISKSSTWQETFAAFSCPDSGSLILRFESQVADPEIIYLDNTHIGSYTKLIDISQAEIIAHAYYPATANCDWPNTTIGSLVAYSTDNDCPAITVESSVYEVDATDNNLPDLDFDYLPSGKYEVTAVMSIGHSLSAGDRCVTAIGDGLNTRGATSSRHDASSATQWESVSTTAIFEYTSGGARNFAIYGRTSAGECSVTNRDSPDTRLTWTVKRFPTSTEKAVSLDTQGMLWTGYHGTGCGDAGWTRTAAAYGDFSVDSSGCVLTEVYNQNVGTVVAIAGVLPGLTWTPRRNGFYEVCATFLAYTQATNNTASFRMLDGSTVIAESEHRSFTESTVDGKTLCGTMDITSLTARTIKLQGKISSANDLKILNTGQYETGVIWWKIRPDTQNFPRAIVIPDVISFVDVDTPNGYGATSNKIRRFSNIGSSVGSCISYSDDANLGAAFLINCDGMYSMSYTDADTCLIGFSKNTTQPTTNIDTINKADRIIHVGIPVGTAGSVSATVPLGSGDVVRPHTNGACPSSATSRKMILTRVH